MLVATLTLALPISQAVLANTSQNLLWNGDMENGNPPTNWSLTGSGASYSRSGDQHVTGTYSIKVTRGTSDAVVYQDLYNYYFFAGAEVTFGAWVYASNSQTAVLYIDDGDSVHASSMHSGTAGWEWLTVTCTVSNTPDFLGVRLGLYNNSYATVYLDGAQLTCNTCLDKGDMENGNPPANWSLAGSGASYSRSIEQHVTGTYSLKVTRGTSDAVVYQNVSNYQDLAGYHVMFSAWVYASNSQTAVLYIDDGDSVSASSMHSGTSGWECLTVEHTVSNMPDFLGVRLGMYNTSYVTAYLDDAVMSVIEYKNTGNPPVTWSNPGSLTAKVDSNASANTVQACEASIGDYNATPTSIDITRVYGSSYNIYYEDFYDDTSYSVGVTNTSWDVNTLYFIQAGIRFNTYWTNAPGFPTDKRRQVANHETGHALGFGCPDGNPWFCPSIMEGDAYDFGVYVPQQYDYDHLNYVLYP